MEASSVRQCIKPVKRYFWFTRHYDKNSVLMKIWRADYQHRDIFHRKNKTKTAIIVNYQYDNRENRKSIRLTLIVVTELCFTRKPWRERGEKRTCDKKWTCMLIPSFKQKCCKQHLEQSVTALHHRTSACIRQRLYSWVSTTEQGQTKHAQEQNPQNLLSQSLTCTSRLVSLSRCRNS